MRFRASDAARARRCGTQGAGLTIIALGIECLTDRGRANRGSNCWIRLTSMIGSSRTTSVRTCSWRRRIGPTGLSSSLESARCRDCVAPAKSSVDQVLRDWLVSDLEVGSTVWVDSADAAVLACTAVAQTVLAADITRAWRDPGGPALETALSPMLRVSGLPVQSPGEARGLPIICGATNCADRQVMALQKY